MTEADFCKHFAAVIAAIPETNVSPRQAAYSCLEEVKQLRAELEQLRAYQRRVLDAATPVGYAIIDEAVLPGLNKPQTPREVGMVERVLERVFAKPALRLVQTPGQTEVTQRLVSIECGCGRRYDARALPVVCCGKSIVNPDGAA